MRRLLPLAILALGACTDPENPEETNEEEVITTVELTLDGETYVWADIEQDGSPLVDDIVLAADSTYTLDVRFLNELEDPAEDITEEVDAESHEHQLFFTTDGPFTYAYDDADANGLPVGLSGTLSTGSAGTGMLGVLLRHLPEQDGAAQKVAGLEDTFAADGPSALPGGSDADVSFAITVE